VKPTTLLATVLIVVGVVAAWRPQAADPDPGPAPPDDATRAIVGPVQEKLADHQEDGRRLAAFYQSLADVIQRDGGNVVTTTSQLREINRRAGLLMFQKTGIQGKHPGLAEAIDTAIAEGVGLEETPDGYEDVQLDAQAVGRLVDVLRAVAWACAGG